MEGPALARIEHRRTLQGTAGTAPSIRGLPPVALVFLALGVVVAAVELWPIANAWWIGATEWWSEAPQRLPVAARSGAMLLLPVAVAWGTPDRERRNRWLWKGALIVAAVQVLRYPAGVASSALFDAYANSEEPVSEAVFAAGSLALSMPLAIGSILGIWALAQGLKDAGGRAAIAPLVAAVAAVALGLLLLIPSLMTGYQLDLQGALNLLSFALNVLFLFVTGLLASHGVAGALNGAIPVGAWRAGAIGTVVVWALPSLNYLSLLVSTFLAEGVPISLPFLGVATYFGWPLFAVAVALGMGRLPVRSPHALGSRFHLRGAAQFTPAA